MNSLAKQYTNSSTTENGCICTVTKCLGVNFLVSIHYHLTKEPCFRFVKSAFKLSKCHNLDLKNCESCHHESQFENKSSFGNSYHPESEWDYLNELGHNNQLIHVPICYVPDLK